MSYKDRAAAEATRLRELLRSCGVSDEIIELLEACIDNTAWIRAKLDDARAAIKNSNVVIPYDNGGGQTGLRENPLFKGYESLLKSYMSGIKQLLDVIPDDMQAVKNEELEKPKTMLELVRSNKAKEA